MEYSPLFRGSTFSDILRYQLDNLALDVAASDHRFHRDIHISKND